MSIRTDSFTDLPNNQDLVKELADQAGVSPQEVNVEDIGPTWGQQISRKAFRGLLLVLVFIAIYIAWRFQWSMAVGGDGRAGARRGDHGGHLRARRAPGHAGDGDRDPDDPRVLAVRHRRDLRQDPGEHRVRGADRSPRLHGRGRPVAEPDRDALGEHLARRAPADPVVAAVRRGHAEGLRVRDVRRGRDRRLLLDLHRRPGAHDRARAPGPSRRGSAPPRRRARRPPAAAAVRDRRRRRRDEGDRRHGRHQAQAQGRSHGTRRANPPNASGGRPCRSSRSKP